MLKSPSCALRSMAEVGLSARTRVKRGHCSNAGGLSAVLRDPLYSNGLIQVFAANARAKRILSAPHSFPEPCGRVGLPSPHQSTLRRANERRHLDIVRSRRTDRLSRVSIIVDRHEGQEPGRRQLLAVHQLRRSLEGLAELGASTERVPMVMTSSAVVRQLRELIAALDRRLPQVERAGEASIAREAAALKARALKRVEELEREQLQGEEV